ncbi:MAG: tRNA (adenosine(37)-N6)-threonylcarbamoyltransferase complex dimerization subunit type 1 TsaB, partial [Candidatus Levybacteria bacterium]|nr:tRNA (adenosine(37)-N6)-threonylcarbamoyltransferase complex dimerization subunit type 1 TsaB [Candidatus Levybacteria bacterium]
RIPNHPIARKIIREVGVPILGPSANFHGEKTPYKFKDLNSELKKLVDYVVEGECTACKESTVIDCSKKPWKVLREGAIKIKNNELGTCLVARRVRNYESKGIILLIDTSSNEKISVGLRINNQEKIISKKIDRQKAQAVLPMIDDLLKKYNLKMSDLTEIQVNIGPGSFTGLRVGIAVANALSFALKIPVNK